MNGRRGEKDMHSHILGILKCPPGAVDVVGTTPGEAGDRGAISKFAGDRLYRLEVARRSDREARLNHIDPQLDQGLGDFEFLGSIHTAPRRLLAIAECGVENGNCWLAHGRSLMADGRKRKLQRPFECVSQTRIAPNIKILKLKGH